MSRVGDGIKKAHRVIGPSFDVVRDSTIDEYCILKINRQVTKPFIREFFQEGSFGYDTDVVSGDIVQTSDGRDFLVMNLTPVILKDTVIEKKGVLYKCNVSGQMYRFSGEATWNDNYELVASAELVVSDCYGLLTEALYGNDLEENEELGNLGISQHELYIPASYGLRVHDRYQSRSGEYYRIESISKRKYDSVWVAIVGEDTR